MIPCVHIWLNEGVFVWRGGMIASTEDWKEQEMTDTVIMFESILSWKLEGQRIELAVGERVKLCKGEEERDLDKSDLCSETGGCSFWGTKGSRGDEILMIPTMRMTWRTGGGSCQLKESKEVFHSVSLFSEHTMHFLKFRNNSEALYCSFHLVSEAHCASRCVIYFSNRNRSMGAQFASNQWSVPLFKGRMQITEGNMIT